MFCNQQCLRIIILIMCATVRHRHFFPKQWSLIAQVCINSLRNLREALESGSRLQAVDSHRKIIFPSLQKLPQQMHGLWCNKPPGREISFALLLLMALCSLTKANTFMMAETTHNKKCTYTKIKLKTSPKLIFILIVTKLKYFSKTLR